MRAPMEPEHHEPEKEERRAYVEPVERTGRFQEPEPAEMPVQRLDLSRWGPIWAGFVITMGTLVLLGLLGVAIGLTSIAGGATSLNGGTIYGGIVLFIGLFLGGWLSSRLAAVGGSFLGLIQGSLVWALTIFISLVLSAIGAGTVLGGFLGGFAPIIAGLAGGATLAGAAANAAWISFGGILVGLIVAAVGGWIGARSPYEAPPR